uniref:Uncharacterized protein n=1 Tax=Meloidogyne hapla TaxID=6305 RepID=A0A1I8BK98_MELHA
MTNPNQNNTNRKRGNEKSKGKQKQSNVLNESSSVNLQPKNEQVAKPPPKIVSSDEVSQDKENNNGQTEQICKSEDQVLKCNVTPPYKSGPKNEHSSKDDSPSDSPPSKKTISEKEYEEYVQLKKIKNKLLEDDKKFNRLEEQIEVLLDDDSELKKFRDDLLSEQSDMVARIMTRSGNDASHFIKLLKEYFVDTWEKVKYDKKKYLPHELLKAAKTYVDKYDVNQGGEKIWGGFSCCVQRYFGEHFGIDIVAHQATNVLCEIALDCRKQNETTSHLRVFIHHANSCHRAYYHTIDKYELECYIDQLATFIEEFPKIDARKVKKKLGSYEGKTIPLSSKNFGNVEIYKCIHSGDIFSYKFDFTHNATTAKTINDRKYKDDHTVDK